MQNVLGYWPKKCHLKYKRQRWGLWRVHGMTMRDKVRACETRRALNVESLLRSRQLSYDRSAMCPECPRKNRRGEPSWLHPRESGPEVDQGPGDVITSSPCLVSCQGLVVPVQSCLWPLSNLACGPSWIIENQEVFRARLEPRSSPKEKRMCTWMNESFQTKKS